MEQVEQRPTYNGYTNYETWVTALWLDNEPDTNEMLYDMANKANASKWDLGDRLRAIVEEMMPDLGASLASDILHHAFYRVNWPEIIETHRE